MYGLQNTLAEKLCKGSDGILLRPLSQNLIAGLVGA